MRKTGLPTLDWFPASFDYDDVHTELANWIAYEEDDCEQLSSLKPSPTGPLPGDPWQTDVKSEHFKRSLAAGMSPANLYGALLLMDCEDELEEDHLSGLSLRHYRIARTTVGHRMHGLKCTSGSDRKSRTHVSQYRPSSRDHMTASQDANRYRGAQKGVVRKVAETELLPELALWIAYDRKDARSGEPQSRRRQDL